ncbi:TonB-dependent receptor [Woodsholea maritima]|uniref:TonB-dependent receptor n=1 Tax=Woodsholea maritima TaxID=240237 RepID=UPI0003755DE8|nr:TonB-dependent receptor [Woodsholea maritima]
MKNLSFLSASVLALCVSVPSLAQNDPWVEVITITAPRMAPDVQDVDIDHSPVMGADAAGLVSRLPGAALVKNGALTGQVQVRGLFGPRIAIRLDGQGFASGGPNLMDPPLSYAPLALVERLEVTRGAAPVSQGPGLGAGVNAVFKRVAFSPDETFIPTHDVSASYRSVDDSWSVGTLAGIANDRHRVGALYSYETGGDLSTPYGDLKGLDHHRLSYGLEYGVKLNALSELGLSVRRQEVDDTATPALGMDIRYIDTTMSRFNAKTELEGWQIAAHVGHTRVDHGMNNFDQRPAPMAMMWRETLASAETWSARLDGRHSLAGGELSVGMDYEQARHSATVLNPNNPGFLVTPFTDIEMTRHGLYAQWQGEAAQWQISAGARLDAHKAEAGSPLIGPALPMGPRMLKMAYDRADRTHTDMTFDGVVRGLYAVRDDMDLRLIVHRKSRVASYVERFAWLPMAASGGLADGNTYVGDLNLDPEVSTGLEVGLDWQTQRAYLRPSVHYTFVDNYIQGVAFDDTPAVVNTPTEMVSAMNGDATPLRFANVDARLYGIDGDFGVRLSPSWRVDGTVSFIRGERADISDDLYRLAPANLRVGLSYDQARWSATLEAFAVAKQDKVSKTNSEAETPGYVVINTFGQWQLNDHVQISAGIENLLDQRYREHLAGYNRNAGLGVGVGQRLPGAGRGAWLRLHSAF